jgi:hypothetical protein
MKYFLMPIKNSLTIQHEITAHLSTKERHRVVRIMIKISRSIKISQGSKIMPSSSTSSRHTARQLSRTRMETRTHFTAISRIFKGTLESFTRSNSRRHSNLVVESETIARVTLIEWALTNTTRNSNAKSKNIMNACVSSKKATGQMIPPVKTSSGDQVQATQILSTHLLNNGCVTRGWTHYHL